VAVACCVDFCFLFFCFFVLCRFHLNNGKSHPKSTIFQIFEKGRKKTCLTMHTYVVDSHGLFFFGEGEEKKKSVVLKEWLIVMYLALLGLNMLAKSYKLQT